MQERLNALNLAGSADPGIDSIEIPGLRIVDEIDRGGSSVVYLAQRTTQEGKGQQVAIKILRGNTPKVHTPRLKRLRKEAGILSRIHHPCLVKIMEVGEISGRSYIVMEYFRGSKTTKLLQNGEFTEEKAVTLGMKLASVLHEIHEHGLVHCDVKPENVLIDDHGEIRLIDFDLAVEFNEKKENNEIAGSFVYASPEQAGILNRLLDGRSDLYSLGVLLFEVCTGRVPFISADVGELIHQHGSRTPPPINQINPKISPALSKIVAKLLAKDPDDRYQSGNSLLEDLTHLDSLNASISAGRQLILGSGDTYCRKMHTTTLIGRDEELKTLLQKWSAVKTSRGSLVLVTGGAGCGKSRLLDEFSSRVRQTGALTLSGWTSSTVAIPFEPFRNAIDDLIDRNFSPFSENKAQVEEKLRNAVGEFAPLLKRFSPRLAQIFESAQELADSTHAHEQFYEALADIFLRLSAGVEPVVLKLPNIHWLDDSSFQVLKRLVKKVKDYPFWIICTANVDKLDSSLKAKDSISEFLSSLDSSRFFHIKVGALDFDGTKKLISANLGSGAIHDDLAQQIYSRTQGNPLAAEQFIEAILNEGLLQPYWGTWNLDAENFKRIALPGDLAQLIIHRIENLSSATKKALGVAAVFGASFSYLDLQEVCDMESDEILLIIREARAASLIEPQQKGDYAFVHELAREILVSQFDANHIKTLHQTIAENLERYHRGEPDFVFKVVNHYNLGEPDRDPQKTYDINVLAGMKAIENFAGQDAYDYCFAAETIASKVSVAEKMEFEKCYGDLCVRLGLLDEGIQHYEKALKSLTHSTDRAEICSHLTSAWLYKGNSAQSWAYLQQVFRELNLPIPKKNFANFFFAPVEFVREWSAYKLRSAFNFPVKQDTTEKSKILMTITNIMKLSRFFHGASGVAINLTLRTMHCAQQVGPSRELAAYYTFHALYLSALGWKKRSKIAINRAISIAQQIGDPIALARAMYYRGVCLFTIGEERRATESTIRAIQDHARWSSGADSILLTTCHHLSYLLRGKTADLFHLNNTTIDYFAKQSGQKYRENEGILISFRMAILASLGKMNDAVELFKKADSNLKDRANSLSQSMIAMTCLAFYYLYQEETGTVADQLIAQNEKLGFHQRTDTMDFSAFYVAKAYIRLAQWNKSRQEFRLSRWQHLKAALAELKKVSRTPLMEGHRLLIVATVRRICGDLKRSERILRRVEGIAYEVDSPWLLYEIIMNRAAAFKQRGNMEAAFLCGQQAFNIALAQGWEAKIPTIKSEYFPKVAFPDSRC